MNRGNFLKSLLGIIASPIVAKGVTSKMSPPPVSKLTSPKNQTIKIPKSQTVTVTCVGGGGGGGASGCAGYERIIFSEGGGHQWEEAKRVCLNNS